MYPQSLENVPVWDDRTWRILAPLDSDLSTEVCVIGLGGSGLTAISELLDLGRRVVGIDADDVAAGAAGRNGGFLLAGIADFHHDAVAAIGRARALRLHELTLEEIHRIAGQAPGTVRFPGSLRIAGSDEEFTDCARQRDAMRADGIPVEPTAFVQQYLESVLREQLDVTAPITHRWAANVSYTLNGLPVLAELRPGTWVIGGYCGTGNAVGALCGRAAARLASGDSSEFARLLVNAGTPETH